MRLWRGCGRSAAVAAVALAGLLVGVAPAAAITPIDLQTTFSQRFDGGPFAAAGDSVDNAGLVNGDSVPDMIVGDANGRGEADIVYGDASANGQVVSQDALAGLGYRLRGTGLPSAFANAGLSVADAGDVNGDGIPDQIVGTPALPNCVDAPNAYVVFGRRGAGATDLDLANIGTPGNTDGYRITGSAASACQLGASVANAGDVNGDGIPDQLIGAPLANAPGRASAGAAFVIFGQRGSVQTIDVDALPAAQGYRLEGPAANGQLGTDVANAGDVDGDGTPDALLGAPNLAFGGNNGAGRSYVMYGQRTGATTIDLALLTAGQGYEIGGPGGGAGAGTAVAPAGDVNGDGVPDALVGAPFAAAAGQGLAFVVFGAPGRASPIDLGVVGTPGNTEGQQIVGAQGSDGFGAALANAGDVDGDGIPDQLIGAPQLGSGNGAAFVVFGSRTPGQVTTAPIGTPGDGTGYILATGQFSAVGFAVAPGVDVNGDGFPDQQITGPFNPVGMTVNNGSTWTVFSSLALPGARTDPATAVTATGATLNGTITPSAVTCQQAGTPTTYQFQYGTTTAYGSVAPGAPGGVGAGTAPRPVAVAVTGLKPSTTYHVRVLARCADGARRFGRDLTFATGTTPPPPPTSKEQCKHGGWKNYPHFKNQGACVSFVATSGKNQPSD